MLKTVIVEAMFSDFNVTNLEVNNKSSLTLNKQKFKMDESKFRWIKGISRLKKKKIFKRQHILPKLLIKMNYFCLNTFFYK